MGVSRQSAGRVLAGLGLLVFAVLMLAQPLPVSLGEPVAYAAQVLTAVAAAAAMVRRGLRAEGPLRRARLLVAGALGCGAAGGVLVLLVPVPYALPRIGDVVHFGFLPLAVLALLAYPTKDTEAGSGQRCLLDGAVAALAMWFLTYSLLLEPHAVGRGMSLPESLTVLAYPTADIFVLGALVGVLPKVHARARRELALTGGGLALMCLSDVAFSVVTTTGTYRADSWVALIAQAGLVLLLVGAGARETEPAGPRLVPRRARWLATLPQLLVVLVLVVSAGIGVSGGRLDGALLGSSVAMTVALLLRQAVGNRDRWALTTRLRAREELFRSLVNGGSDLITLSDPEGVILWASPAVSRTIGWPTDQIVGGTLGDHLHPDDYGAVVAAAAVAAADTDGTSEVLCRLRSASGQWRWMQVLLQDRHADPAVRGLICNARDVHERHLLERQLSHAAYHDPLTGLGNLGRARELLRRCYSDAGLASTAVVLVDLDGFKAVNDTFGHAHGDALLGEVARRLRRSLRDSDEVMRIGGDEFVLVLGDLDAAEAVAERVLATLRTPITVAGTALTIGASIGTASAAGAATPDELLRNADLAMYASKEAGRDRVTAYEPWMHERATHRMQVHRGLRRALEDDTLALHYQPIVDLTTGSVIGAEALLRWDDPDVGPVSPEVFIPLAEESGIIGEIDVWVLDRACRDIADWDSTGLLVPRVSINVSRRHMTAELPPLVERTLARYGLDGSRLCIEVTESAVVADAAVASAALSRVRELGVTVALDDFGSGESSLSQLARLPVDTVKIDMSFTRSALSDGGARRLLTSIVRVCQSLSLPVVAEGIEHEELARLLAQMGCEFGQGWHFGRPQPPLGFSAMLGLRRPLPSEPHARDAVDRVADLT